MIEDLFNTNWQQIGLHAVQMLVAFALSIPAGLNRERAHHLGLRTIPLVAVAACGFIIMGRINFAAIPDAQGRIVQAVVTGVGFLGGGAIVKNESHVQGTSTAATIWCTAAIGVAVGYESWAVAAILAIANFGILVFLHPLGKLVNQDETGEHEAVGKGADASESS